MTLDKSVVFRRCGEERLHPVYFKFHLDLAGKALLEFTERYIDIFLRTERGADGCKQMGVPRSNRMLIVQLQGTYKSGSQLREEMKRAAQKRDMSADRLPACKSADCLVYHCLENRGRQVFLGSALINQGLDIRFCKYAAACGNRIQSLIILGVII